MSDASTVSLFVLFVGDGGVTRIEMHYGHLPRVTHGRVIRPMPRHPKLWKTQRIGEAHSHREVTFPVGPVTVLTMVGWVVQA